jgi:hypothetical protein
VSRYLYYTPGNPGIDTDLNFRVGKAGKRMRLAGVHVSPLNGNGGNEEVTLFILFQGVAYFAVAGPWITDGTPGLHVSWFLGANGEVTHSGNPIVTDAAVSSWPLPDVWFDDSFEVQVSMLQGIGSFTECRIVVEVED